VGRVDRLRSFFARTLDALVAEPENKLYVTAFLAKLLLLQ
jgi:hypothetical protein